MSEQERAVPTLRLVAAVGTAKALAEKQPQHPRPGFTDVYSKFHNLTN